MNRPAPVPAVPSAPSAQPADRAQVPLTILGGYLGAGKTTLLNHLLRHSAGARIAVVVNDFGSVNIDADLIETRDEQTISIAGGCVCCSFGDDLSDTLRSLRDAPVPFDHIVVETSGVALPANLRATVSLIQGVRVAATVVLADAESVRRLASDRYVGDTVHAQLRAADLLLLTKGDLLSDDETDDVERWLRAQVAAPVLRSVMGAVPIDILLGVTERAPDSAMLDRATTGGAPKRESRGSLLRPGPGATLRPPAHRSARFDTETFPVAMPVDPQRLAQALAALPEALARAKGLVRAPDGRHRVIQVVGRRASVDAAPANAAGEGRLVAIAAGGALDRDAVRAAIAQAATPHPPEQTARLR